MRTYAVLDSPVGPLSAVDEDGRLVGLYVSGQRHRPYGGSLGERNDRAQPALREQLDAYWEGELRGFEVTLTLRGTAFQQRVWAALQQIPYGQTWSYRRLAEEIGSPGAARAVGLATGRNPISIVVPCHRVVGASGGLTGYAGGIWRKRWLLDHEAGTLPAALGGGAGTPTAGQLWRQEVARRFRDINGDHPMSEEDDAYVDEHYVSLEEVCVERRIDPVRVRQQMLAGGLPLPSYLRSDGTEMVYPDYFELADAAGGVERLPAWFSQQWSDPEEAAEEWEGYLSGQYVCLRRVTPGNMRRKTALVTAIDDALGAADPQSSRWIADLHHLVDELDALEPPFAHYDRLRFKGPTSREQHIEGVRAQYPKGASLSSEPGLRTSAHHYHGCRQEDRQGEGPRVDRHSTT